MTDGQPAQATFRRIPETPPGAGAPAATPSMPPKNLRQKLLAVMKDIGRIPKRGRNERFNYDYVLAADIDDEVRKALAAHGVVFTGTEKSITFSEGPKTQAGGTMRVCIAVMLYTFRDSDSDETIVVESTGEGHDVGDKAIYKAKTGALKYALIQNFLVATGDDPEDERGNGGGGETRKTGRVRTVAEKNKPPETERASAEAVAEIKRFCQETKTEFETVAGNWHCATIEELTPEQAAQAKLLLLRKKAKAAQQRT